MKHWHICKSEEKILFNLARAEAARLGGSPEAGVADRGAAAMPSSPLRVAVVRSEHGGAQHPHVVGASTLVQRAPRTPADRPSLRPSRPVLGGSGSRPVLGGGGRSSLPRFSPTRARWPRFPGGRCAAAPEGRPRGLAASGPVGSRAEPSEESTKLGPPRGPPRVLSVAKNSHSEPKCFRVAKTSKLLVNLKGWCCSRLLRTHVCVSENHGLCKMISSEAVSSKTKVRVHERIGRLCPGRVAFLSNMENLRDRISG